MKIFVAVLLTAFVGSTHGYTTSIWMSKYDRPSKFLCPAGQSVSRIASVYSKRYGDRVWDFSCQYVVPMGKCLQTKGWVNKWHQKMSFNCPASYVLVGIESIHKNRIEDRIFKLTCCHSGVRLSSNKKTGWINNFHSQMNLKLASNEMITGMYSIAGKRDRKWIMKVSKVIW